MVSVDTVGKKTSWKTSRKKGLQSLLSWGCGCQKTPNSWFQWLQISGLRMRGRNEKSAKRKKFLHLTFAVSGIQIYSWGATSCSCAHSAFTTRHSQPQILRRPAACANKIFSFASKRSRPGSILVHFEQRDSSELSSLGTGLWLSGASRSLWMFNWVSRLCCATKQNMPIYPFNCWAHLRTLWTSFLQIFTQKPGIGVHYMSLTLQSFERMKPLKHSTHLSQNSAELISLQTHVKITYQFQTYARNRIAFHWLGSVSFHLLPISWKNMSRNVS